MLSFFRVSATVRAHAQKLRAGWRYSAWRHSAVIRLLFRRPPERKVAEYKRPNTAFAKFRAPNVPVRGRLTVGPRYQ